MTPLNKLGFGTMMMIVLAFILMVLLETPIDVMKGTVMVTVYFSGLVLAVQRKIPSKHLPNEDYLEPKPVKVIYIEPMVSNPRPRTFHPDETILFKTRKTKTTSYFYLWDYYPKKKYPDLVGELHRHRIAVWDFKDGLNPRAMACKISSALLNKFNKPLLSEHYLAIIPASTSYSTFQRFHSFVSYVVSNTGMQDGFDIVKNSANRQAIHYQDNRQIDHSNHITVGEVHGKDIILFDDVTTTGRSFRSVRSALLKNGAHSVTGVFLAKTYCK